MESKYSKESLSKLLAIIKQIVDDSENTWFKNRLIEMVVVNEDSISTLSRKMSKIETHLSLDGIEMLDYSDIEDEKTRNQLIADSIQMQKYRLGKIDNKIDFAEYCRYAHYQAEELINYFFNKKFHFVDDAKSYFQLYNDELQDGWKTFETVPYYRKMKVVTAQIKVIKENMGLKDGINLTDILYKVNDIRNEKSHRSSLLIIKSDDEILREIELRGIDLSKWNNFTKGSDDLNLYNKGKAIIFKREQNFASIQKAIYQLKTMIVHLLNDKNLAD